ncbi:hypothetical protein NW762_014711 [Fusarium torreyae]|uniref:Apple domain-containing protein n=1 Tax=Fusarium torreyae TaxID=1237075 RepID=A0A9W8V6H4_9HYPO|nr:hypothetical protein NW762_014711 [Fusarium torreyae]
MVALKSFIVLLGFSAEALCAASPPAVCSTALGTKTVVNVPTSTTTAVQKITVVKRVIRKVNVNVIPVAKTYTVRTTDTSTSTYTEDQETDTATDTVTSEATVVSTRTAWNTATTTSTTTTTKYTTTTVSKSPGFTAIQNDPLYQAKKRDVKRKREVEIQTAAPGGTLPQSVKCVRKVPTYSTKVVSTTVQGIRVTRKAATKTKTLSYSTTVTTTEYPSDASTTVTTTVYPTTTSFEDVTSTTTITQTVTVESQIPIETAYAICSSDNILVTANGGGRYITYDSYQYTSNVLNIGNGYTPVQCCNACAARFDCQATFMQDDNCHLYTAIEVAECDNNRQITLARYFTSKQQPSTPVYILSNGPCGQYKNGGDYRH